MDDMSFKRIISYLLIVTALTAPAMGLAGQGVTDTLTQRVHFRVGSSRVDLDFRGNGEHLDRFASQVNAVLADPELVVDGVTVETGASPEGGLDLNERLAMDRAKAIRRALLDRLSLNASQVKAYSIGIDWEGLTMAVRESSCPWRDDILDVIARTGVRHEATPDATSSCQSQLKALDGGRAWRWMLDNVFPGLRQGAGTIRCVVRAKNPEVFRVRDTLVVMHEWEGPDSGFIDRVNALLNTPAPVIDYAPKGWKRHNEYRVPVVALRTNVLLPLMNLTAEAALSNRWSVEAGVAGPWLYREIVNRFAEPQKECAQGLQGMAGMRLYLGRMHNSHPSNDKLRMAGHSFGFLVGGGYFDVEHDWTGKQGEYLFTGIDWSYMRPLGKGNVRLGVSLGVGYAFCWYRGYDVHETGGRLIGNYRDGTWDGPVPVRAGINLMVPIVYRNNNTGSHE